MNVPIFRPMTFVGPERLGVFSLFYDWAYTGHGFPMIGSGNNKFQLLDVSDFVDLIIATLTIDENKTNDTFNVGSRKFKTMKEDYQAVLNYAGYNKKIKPFPKWIALTGLRILNFLHISPLYKWVYETAPRDSVASIEKVQTKLGFCPKYSTSEALIRNYKWYVENLEKFKSKTGKTHRVPWKQGILKIVKNLNVNVLAVLHDIQLACRFSDYIYLIKDGRIRYKGKPEEVITKDNMREIYDVECEVINRGSNQILIQYT